jgi:peroxiredoxin
MLLAVGARCALILGLLVAFGCGNETSDAAPRQSPPAPRAKNERPLPAFEGRTLDGSTLSSSSLLGRRLLLFFFSIDAPEAPAVAQAVAAVSRLRGKHNFDVVGVGVADTSRELEALAQAYDLDFPIIDDTRGSIVSRLGLRVPVALVGVDAEGYVSFGLASFPQNAADVAGFVESDLRQQLRLPALGESLEPVLGEKPLAPEFSAETLNGGTFDLAKARGRPVILVFFLHSSSRSSPTSPRRSGPGWWACPWPTTPRPCATSSSAPSSTSSRSSSTRIRRSATRTARPLAHRTASSSTPRAA